MSVSRAQFLFKAQGGLAPATQAEMEAATTAQSAVTPAVQKYHPGNAKAWFQMITAGGAPSLITGYNVASITDVNTGEFRINFGVSFSSANYGFVAGGNHAVALQLIAPFYASTLIATGGQFPINTMLVNAATAADPGQPVGGAFFGDQ